MSYPSCLRPIPAAIRFLAPLLLSLVCALGLRAQTTDSGTQVNDDLSTMSWQTCQYPDGSMTSTSTTTYLDGSSVTITSASNADTSSSSTTVTTGADGSTSSSSTSTDASGNTTTTSSSTASDGSSSQTTQITYASGGSSTTTTATDSLGFTTTESSTTDANGHTSTSESVTHADGSVTVISSSGGTQSSTTTYPNGSSSSNSTTQNADNSVTTASSTVGADGSTSATSSTVYPNGTSSVTTSSSGPSGSSSSTTTTYSNGTTSIYSTTTDASGNVTTFSTNPDGSSSTCTLFADGHSVTTVTDASGNTSTTTSVTNADGSVTTTNPDGSTTVTFPDGGSETMTTVQNSDGSATTTTVTCNGDVSVFTGYPDGHIYFTQSLASGADTTATRTPDGNGGYTEQSTTTWPDGSTVTFTDYQRANGDHGDTEVYVNANGIHGTRYEDQVNGVSSGGLTGWNADGSGETADWSWNPDETGTSSDTKYNADKSISSTTVTTISADPNGGFITVVTTINPDGSYTTTTILADGSTSAVSGTGYTGPSGGTGGSGSGGGSTGGGGGSGGSSSGSGGSGASSGGGTGGDGSGGGSDGGGGTGGSGGTGGGAGTGDDPGPRVRAKYHRFKISYNLSYWQPSHGDEDYTNTFENTIIFDLYGASSEKGNEKYKKLQGEPPFSMWQWDNNWPDPSPATGTKKQWGGPLTEQMFLETELGSQVPTVEYNAPCMEGPGVFSFKDQQWKRDKAAVDGTFTGDNGSISEKTEIEFLPGGKPNSQGKYVWQLKCSATDDSAGTDITSQCQFDGKTPDTNGYIYKVYQNNTTNAIAVNVPSGTKNYTFSVQPSKYKIPTPFFRNKGRLPLALANEIAYLGPILGLQPPNPGWRNSEVTEATVPGYPFDASKWAWHQDINYNDSLLDGTTVLRLPGPQFTNQPDPVDGPGNDVDPHFVNTPDAKGLIYAPDAPSVLAASTLPIGTIYRMRRSLRTWVTYDGGIVSDIVLWHTFITIQKQPDGTWYRINKPNEIELGEDTSDGP